MIIGTIVGAVFVLAMFAFLAVYAAWMVVYLFGFALTIAVVALDVVRMPYRWWRRRHGFYAPPREQRREQPFDQWGPF